MTYNVWLSLCTQRTSSTPADSSTPVDALGCVSSSRVSEMCPLPTPPANTSCWSAWPATIRSPAYGPASFGTRALESGSVIASLTRAPLKPSVALALSAKVADSLAIPLRPRLTRNRAVAFFVPERYSFRWRENAFSHDVIERVTERTLMAGETTGAGRVVGPAMHPAVESPGHAGPVLPTGGARTAVPPVGYGDAT